MSAIFHAGISGYRGRMGRAVSQVLDAREDVVVAARFDWGETADISLCDVIIDFSTPDASVALAQSAAERRGPALVIGFAAETTDLEANARSKLSRKGCDWIVGNDVSADVFGADGNTVLLVTKDGADTWPRLSKTEVAAHLADRIADHFSPKA
ncbi:MAG: phosphopantothenoylcysteine decarboxylase [Hyphomonas sp.]